MWWVTNDTDEDFERECRAKLKRRPFTSAFLGGVFCVCFLWLKVKGEGDIAPWWAFLAAFAGTFGLFWFAFYMHAVETVQLLRNIRARHRK